MMLLKCCTQYASKFGKLSNGHRTEKRSVFIPIPKKGSAKEFSNYHIITHISHASEVMLKILQVRLPQHMNHELPDVQPGLKKAEKPEIKLPTPVGSKKKQENSRRNIYSASLIILNPLTVWITTNYGKFFKEMGIPDHLTCLLRNL